MSLAESLFELSADMLCVANTDGFFELVNPAFMKVLGYAPEELLHKPFADFIYPDDIEKTVKAVEKLKTGELITRFVNRYRHKDGFYRILDWSSRELASRFP